MTIFITKSQLLLNFSNCINWEERYMYIIDLGKLLPKFPENMRKKKYLISGCQSHTWIAIKSNTQHSMHSIKFYGDSDSSIVKGIITIIFSLYQKLTFQEIFNFDARPFLSELKLQQNLTTSRSQGIYFILDSIHTQTKKIKRLL